MSTKRKSDGTIHKLFSPYDSAYEAFTNYMNVLSDFILRVKQQYPETIENEELNALLTTIQNQAFEIHKLEEKVNRLKSKESKPKAASKTKKKDASSSKK